MKFTIVILIILVEKEIQGSIQIRIEFQQHLKNFMQRPPLVQDLYHFQEPISQVLITKLLY